MSSMILFRRHDDPFPTSCYMILIIVNMILFYLNNITIHHLYFLCILFTWTIWSWYYSPEQYHLSYSQGGYLFLCNTSKSIEFPLLIYCYFVKTYPEFPYASKPLSPLLKKLNHHSSPTYHPTEITEYMYFMIQGVTSFLQFLQKLRLVNSDTHCISHKYDWLIYWLIYCFTLIIILFRCEYDIIQSEYYHDIILYDIIQTE